MESKFFFVAQNVTEKSNTQDSKRCIDAFFLLEHEKISRQL